MQLNEKLVTFYTGVSSYAILIAIFQFLESVIPHSRNKKVSTFDAYIMALMKLRLNVRNQDLAYRFGISQMTISRMLKEVVYCNAF